MDINVVIEAASIFCKSWNQQTENIEKEDISSSVYDAVCEIDEVLISLVERISECSKEITKEKIYGNSSLVKSHDAVISRMTT